MSLTIEQALCSMTFWGADISNMEREVGAIAPPLGPGHDGWFADMVVRQCNPLAIHSTNSYSIADVAALYPIGPQAQARNTEVINDFIRKFRPALTIVGGVPVFAHPDASNTWQSVRQ